VTIIDYKPSDNYMKKAVKSYDVAIVARTTKRTIARLSFGYFKTGQK